MNPETQKSQTALKEEEVLKFWQEKEVFKKTLEKDAPKGKFVFYEGPPTANAKPALHHLESRVFKDIIPRFKTMQGFNVRRKAGWDTHGLPVELQIEKKLGLKSKKEIEQYGVEEFNKQCKDSVFEYIGDWEKFTDRIGYWVDKKDAYYTFDTSYIESVWNIVKTVNDRGLLYKDYKVLPWCPRCGTALSSHELAQGYQDDKDLSVTAKFKIRGTENGYFLAWTTTPWTLPGNVGLAVGKDVVYVEVKIATENGSEILVLAKERLSVIQGEYEIIAEHKGSEMVGMEYEPLYPFLVQKFEEKDKESFAKAYKVYSADFVTTTDGTGIVHTAVMYGQDDFILGTQIGLPKFHLVKDDGNFLDGMDFLSNRFVKDEEVAVDIIKDLAHRGLLFKKEKYEHSYPHCWRCKTPLIYYARDSWYIAMSKLREELVKENENIVWEPSHIKEGRFGEWLREIKDWAISRERYWGTPLPVWQDSEGNIKVIGGLDDLKKYIKTNGNKYFLVRHGEGEHNVANILSCKKEDNFHLTEKGRKQVEESAKVLKEKGITKIISSPFVRTTETAEIIREVLGLTEDKLTFDDRLGEHDLGVMSGQSVDEYHKLIKTDEDIFDIRPEQGENLSDVKNRTGNLLYDVDKTNTNEVILFVTHEHTAWALESASRGYNRVETSLFGKDKEEFIRNAEVHEISFIPLPHNSEYEVDLHKPYIDGVELVDEKGSSLKRVREVMDVWFDSGSMPFAQDHFPWNKNELAYPADFISEAIDQTRGWFYTLHAIGILMGKGRAFKNVICLGHILDKDGKKMSKSVGNILDPWELMNKYGVDALRLWMYMVNQPGDSKNFDEKTVDEIVKKVFNPLLNIVAFYELYKDDKTLPHNKSQNVLDKWILSRLNELVEGGTKTLEKFQVFESARPIRDFVNDFSTWYVRRSRDRFKSENAEERNEALATTAFVLIELSKYMAPFTPFFAEEVYQKMKNPESKESVHLDFWPNGGDTDSSLIDSMSKVRENVTLALELRQKSGHKVRQPLNTLIIKESFSEELLSIIADEVNVKEVVVGDEVKLDTNLTPELIEEGVARDIIRAIQDARKTEKLNPSDVVNIVFCTDKQGIIYKHLEMIKSPTGVNDISYTEEKQKYNVPDIGGETTFSILR
ncbi:MAG TPA: class I tRNA ligase family protein [Parcubacteria group bacterium]|jgi:isoleucyl-tRNA synthetase|nr:class I tRNA ligase family protein [Parcubacteria group bacterium]